MIVVLIDGVKAAFELSSSRVSRVSFVQSLKHSKCVATLFGSGVPQIQSREEALHTYTQEAVFVHDETKAVVFKSTGFEIQWKPLG